MSDFKYILGIPLTLGLMLLLSACPDGGGSSDNQGLVQIAQTQVGPGHDDDHDHDVHEDEHEESETHEHETEHAEEGDAHDHEEEHEEGDDNDHDHSEAKLIEDSEGHSVELLSAYLVLDHFELTRCTSLSGLLQRTLDGITGTAWAADGHDHGHDHGGDRPEVPDDQRNLNRPHVINLMEADEAELILGNMRVPEGRYCGLRLSVVPARDDAFGLPEDLSMNGVGFYMNWEQDIDGTTEKTLDSTGLALPLNIELELTEPLVINDGQHHIVMAVHYGHLFEDVDLSAISDAELRAALLEGIEHALKIHDLGSGSLN